MQKTFNPLQDYFIDRPLILMARGLEYNEESISKIATNIVKVVAKYFQGMTLHKDNLHFHLRECMRLIHITIINLGEPNGTIIEIFKKYLLKIVGK